MGVAFTLHKPVSHFFSFLLFFLILLLPATLSALIVSEPYHQKKFAQLITSFSSVQDRSSGTIGATQTAEFIKSQLKNLGYSAIGSQAFSLPFRQKGICQIKVGHKSQFLDIDPFLSNAISPGTIPEPGLTAVKRL